MPAAHLDIGRGLTPGSDRLVAETIIGSRSPDKDDGAYDRMPNDPPPGRLAMHMFVESVFTPDLFAMR